LILWYFPGWGGAGNLPPSSPLPAYQLLHPNPEWVGIPSLPLHSWMLSEFHSQSVYNLLWVSLTSCISPGPWVMVTFAQLSILSCYIFCYRFLYIQSRNFCNLILS
jgi:hypothetical protein